MAIEINECVKLDRLIKRREKVLATMRSEEKLKSFLSISKIARYEANKLEKEIRKMKKLRDMCLGE